MMIFIMGAGAAKAMSMKAGCKLDNECRLYINQFGSVRVGKAMHTTVNFLEFVTED